MYTYIDIHNSKAIITMYRTIENTSNRGVHHQQFGSLWDVQAYIYIYIYIFAIAIKN